MSHWGRGAAGHWLGPAIISGACLRAEPPQWLPLTLASFVDCLPPVEEGESVLQAFYELDGAVLRQRELTETFKEFEAARHQVRLAVFALPTAQGVGPSELGRRLGNSRQLAPSSSRIGTSEPLTNLTRTLAGPHYRGTRLSASDARNCRMPVQPQTS